MTLLDRMRQAILQGAKEPEMSYLFGEAVSRIEVLEEALAACEKTREK